MKQSIKTRRSGFGRQPQKLNAQQARAGRLGAIIRWAQSSTIRARNEQRRFRNGRMGSNVRRREVGEVRFPFDRLPSQDCC